MLDYLYVVFAARARFVDSLLGFMLCPTPSPPFHPPLFAFPIAKQLPFNPPRKSVGRGCAFLQ